MNDNRAPVVRIGDPDGPYRRRIRTVTVGRNVVEGALEDDFHHFEVTLRHDGEYVTGVDVRSRRWPWSTCPDAAAHLRPIDGMRLSTRCTAIAGVADPRMNCTHQFDLAGLCVSHAARGDERRQYDAEVPAAVDGVMEPRLWRDGELVLAWTLSSRDGIRRLVDSPPYDEAPWRGGFFRWADDSLEPDAAEAAIVLRRACEIGMGRGMDLEAVDSAAELGPLMGPVCYTMQPAVAPVAFRNRGSIRDFARHTDALLHDQ
ncbi:MAG TPA: hypothetical protein VGO28_10150 [Acidimicrobiia bacterium]